ncbi:MAG: Phage-associated protein [uncultured bacterium]|nr:MAG: Phage-associated protein [uncultured bacterium]
MGKLIFYKDTLRGENMLSVFDVAKYILTKHGPMTTMKLQKLVYYSQAWSLVWDGEPLFDSDFQAWSNGPVCPELFEKHKGLFKISASKINGDITKITGQKKSTIDSVLGYYGDKDGHWLSVLTHKEKPWIEARKGIEDGENCCSVITKDMMQEYYDGLSE